MCVWMVGNAAFKTRKSSGRTDGVLRIFFPQQERNNLYFDYIFFEKNLKIFKFKKFLSVIFGPPCALSLPAYWRMESFKCLNAETTFQ